MRYIVVIGAGQLGSRHIQALAKITFPAVLQIVDPSTEALKNARLRFEQIERGEGIESIDYFSSIESLAKEVDLCIIATVANIRLSVLRALVQRIHIKNLLLEKVLFQTIEDFHIAKQLLKENKIDAWVNCPRRMYLIYQQIKELLGDDSKIYYRMSGGDWGLGCNAIHFLDLLAFLTGSTVTSIDNTGLDKTIRESKRPGFIEFTGCLKATFDNGSELELNSIFANEEPIVQSINTDSHEIIISENKGVVNIQDKLSGTKKNLTFEIPYVSGLTNLAAKNILYDKKCNLTVFDESMRLHLPMIESLLIHLDTVNGTNTKLLPVT